MIEIFVPLIVACQSMVTNPLTDCRVFLGPPLLTEEQCAVNLATIGLPSIQQQLPEGGKIHDITCTPMTVEGGTDS